MSPKLTALLAVVVTGCGATVLSAFTTTPEVITELVVNHTSDQHSWFKRARRSKPHTDARNWYVWSDTDQRYLGTRIIFNDTEKSNWAWDPVAGAYYWHHPELNGNQRFRKPLLYPFELWGRP